MKQFTPKQRRGIYLRAAESVFAKKYCGCYAICANTDYPKYYLQLMPHELEQFVPEFFMFKPSPAGMFWWGVDDDGPRVLALIFAAEMTKDAKE